MMEKVFDKPSTEHIRIDIVTGLTRRRILTKKTTTEAFMQSERFSMFDYDCQLKKFDRSRHSYECYVAMVENCVHNFFLSFIHNSLEVSQEEDTGNFSLDKITQQRAHDSDIYFSSLHSATKIHTFWCVTRRASKSDDKTT